jgi:hypothetical protein
MLNFLKHFSSTQDKTNVRRQFPLSQTGNFREPSHKLKFYNQDFKKLVNAELEPKLKSKGFVGSDYRYYQDLSSHINFIFLGLSKYGGAISIDASIKFKRPFSLGDVDPLKAYPLNCESWKRLSPDDKDNWWTFRDTVEENNRVIEEMWALIQIVAFPYFKRFESLSEFFRKIKLSELRTEKFYDKYEFCGRKIFGYFSIMQYYLLTAQNEKAIEVAKLGLDEYAYPDDKIYISEFNKVITTSGKN